MYFEHQFSCLLAPPFVKVYGLCFWPLGENNLDTSYSLQLQFYFELFLIIPKYTQFKFLDTYAVILFSK